MEEILKATFISILLFINLGAIAIAVIAYIMINTVKMSIN